jgi:hypothetical protein
VEIGSKLRRDKATTVPLSADMVRSHVTCLAIALRLSDSTFILLFGYIGRWADKKLPRPSQGVAVPASRLSRIPGRTTMHQGRWTKPYTAKAPHPTPFKYCGAGKCLNSKR